MLCSGANAQPTLSANTELSTAGYFQLSWESDFAGSFELQQANNAEFEAAQTIYTGSDSASVLSGLPNGDFFYRVRLNQQSWSEPVQVTVQHHSLTKAFAFFALGAVIFMVLIIIMMKSDRQVSAD